MTSRGIVDFSHYLYPLNFLRHQITIDYIKGNEAVLSQGPIVGTGVVTVATAELYGTEMRRGLLMLRWIVGLSLEFCFIVLDDGYCSGGFWCSCVLRHMLVDVFPESRCHLEYKSKPQPWGSQLKEVEGLVTIPLEQALQGVAGLDVMRSKSVEQLSSVLLIFKPGTDLIRARQLVQERVALVTPTLPSWAALPTLLPPLSSTARTMKIGLSSSEMSLIELSELTRWKIRPRL